uniref:Uncharacterized protein n=1 Tax=Triticum urartu TaxID=4572 RepID=A0A8R7QPE1_TRIUA
MSCPRAELIPASQLLSPPVVFLLDQDRWACVDAAGGFFACHKFVGILNEDRFLGPRGWSMSEV